MRTEYLGVASSRLFVDSVGVGFGSVLSSWFVWS